MLSYSILCNLIAGFLFLSGMQPGPETVTFNSLLKELIDREQLARYPSPYYETGQFSSYDRRTQKPGGPNWFANLDRSHFLRTEQNKGRTEYVLMDTTGPGAVTRFWMTFAGPGAGEGTLRVYLDKEDQPAIEGNVLDVLSGDALTGEPLATSVSPQTAYKIRGHNLYLPLPYRKHIKITYESDDINKPGAPGKSEAVYYNINYRSYEDGTPVETFRKDQIHTSDSLLQAVQKQLSSRDKQAYLNELAPQTDSISRELKPGESFTRRIKGPSAIRHLGFRLQAANTAQALRSTILEMNFDDRRTVWVPVGDFFGTGYQYRGHDTWYTTVTDNHKLQAFWIMPFQKTARFQIHNLGRQTIKLLDGSIDYTGWDWNHRSMHFGASWRNYSDVQTGERKAQDGSGGPFDFNYTQLEGKGVYVGDVLTVFNTAHAWWGEGDEKIYVDGEDFPSHFGTGTEDYYGYAWVRPEKFTHHHPFIAQPDGSGNLHPGYTVNLRYRGLDAIPFRSSLKVDMEMWHWVSTTIDYAPTAFFYTKPGAAIHVSPDTAGAREPVALKRTDIISPEITNQHLEGENLALDTLTGGSIDYQNLNHPGWSQNKQLWWLDGKPGDRLQTYFIPNQPGKYIIKGRFTRAHDYGRVRISINGETALSDFNGYNDSLVTTTIQLGRHQLQKGENILSVEILDYSPEEDKAFWGLDYLEFESIEN